MKLLSFAASSSSQSINRQLVAYANQLLSAGLIDGITIDDIVTEDIDLNDFEMPIYSIDRQLNSGIPEAARTFFAKIGSADAVLVSFAEHNGAYTAAYKNIFDWSSRIEARVYQDKPTVMLATSPGPGGGGNVLKAAVNSAPFYGNDLRASLAIPSFYENFDPATTTLTNPDLDTQLRAALSTLSVKAAL